MHRPLASLLFALLLAAGCVGYTSALGFRARQAVLKGDVEAFPGLMEEAADTTPAGPLDNPEMTVFTHFLDLAGDPRFFPYVESWMAKGWVSDDLTCVIHRARYRATRSSDPEEAARAAAVCVERARGAAMNPERSWEVERCLEEAPFLVDTSTSALGPYLEMVVDAAEPLRFRYGLLDGMTRVYITSAQRLEENRSDLTREEARRTTLENVSAQVRRLEWLFEATKPHVDATLLSSATARGVLEIENVLVPLGQSFIGRYSLSESPEDRDLAWGWVRAMKAKKKIPRIAGLGLWSRDREPEESASWFICSREPKPSSGGASIAANAMIDAISVRADGERVDPQAIREAHCKDQRDGAPYPHVLGPFPLEATARGSLTSSASGSLGESVTVRLRRRVLP